MAEAAHFAEVRTIVLQHRQHHHPLRMLKAVWRSTTQLLNEVHLDQRVNPSLGQIRKRREALTRKRQRIRLPLSCEFLRFGYLRGGHKPCDEVSKSCRTFFALRSSQVEPHVCVDTVLRDAQAVVVEDPEHVLGAGVALLGERTNKPHGGRVRVVASFNRSASIL